MAKNKPASSSAAKATSVFAEVSAVDVEEFLRSAQKYKTRVTSSKAAARKALIDAGIYTKSGKLSSHYK